MENKCTFFVWNEYSVPVGGFLVNSIWKDDSVFLFIDSGKWAQELPRGWDPGMISFSPSGAHQAPQRKQVRSLPNAYIGWKRKNSQTERWEKELRKTGETRWSPREHAVLLALQMLKNKPSSSLVKNLYYLQRGLIFHWSHMWRTVWPYMRENSLFFFF